MSRWRGVAAVRQRWREPEDEVHIGCATAAGSQSVQGIINSRINTMRCAANRQTSPRLAERGGFIWLSHTRQTSVSRLRT